MAGKPQAKNELVIESKRFQVIKPLPTEIWQDRVNLETQEAVFKERRLRLEDIEWRLKQRAKLKNFLLWLLVIQNSAVFILVTGALIFDKMTGLQAVFATLVGGTLLETASMVYIITKWLFSDIHYDMET